MTVRATKNGETLLTHEVSLGGNWNARRVTKKLFEAFQSGAKIEVETPKGWEERKVIESWGRYYLRLP